MADEFLPRYRETTEELLLDSHETNEELPLDSRETNQEFPLQYPEPTEELRYWLSDRGQLNTGDRDMLIFRRARYEISCDYRGISSQEHTLPGMDCPSILEGKRITEWGMQDGVSQIQLYFDHSGESVTFDGPTMPEISIESELAKRLRTLRTRLNGEMVHIPKKARSLRILKAMWAKRKSKAAARKRGEYFDRAWCEEHIVVGLQLEGMPFMEFIYALDPAEYNVTSAYGDMVMNPLIPTYRG